jgi:hypothetical protein
MRTMLAVYTMLIASVSLAGCTVTDRLTSRRVVGSIPSERPPLMDVIRAPAQVAVDQAFPITVITYGSSSCTTPDGADVQVAGRVAVITPYDRIPGGNVACTADLAQHPRDVRITFSEAGPATIRVIGAIVDGAPSIQEQQIIVTP